MSYEVGEVREFANGVCEAWPNMRGDGGTVRMCTIQKIWNGSAWIELREADEILRRIIKERRSEYSI